MRTRAPQALIGTGLAAAVLTAGLAGTAASAPAAAVGAAPEARAATLHWKTFVQFKGAKLQGCVERPSGSDTRIMHFRHDTRQATTGTKVKVLENINGIIAIVWRDAMTAPGHVVTSGRTGFRGEDHRFRGFITTRSGATQATWLAMRFFPTC